MNQKLNFLLLVFGLQITSVYAQEFNGRVTVNAQQVATTVDKTIFNTLQTQLTDFINKRKWTKDNYLPQERITCSYLLNITSSTAENIYKATLTVQAVRPVYNSTYQASLLNYQDADVTFKYVQFQPMDFNENRVQGSDPLTANLTALFAYYSYLILAMNYDSFSPKGGEEWFQKAQNIVNNAPESGEIAGWKSFEGLRNRYWMTENWNNSRYNQLHDVIYNYYRGGLDLMFEDNEGARMGVLDALNLIQEFNQQNPNTMAIQTFMQGKYQEFIGIFKKADPTTKNEAKEILASIDIANSDKYRQELR